MISPFSITNPSTTAAIYSPAPLEHHVESASASDVIAALSRALDLTEGQPLGHSMRACLIGMRLGREIGLDAEALGELYYALLLKDTGCSSNASKMAALFGSDDRVVKPQMKSVDWHDRMRVAIATWNNTGQGGALWSRMRYFIGIAQAEDMTKDLIAARCERGADIAHRLGFPPRTVEAIRWLDEHWNGKGFPVGRRGDEIPLLSRILNIAQTAEVFLSTQGIDGVDHVLKQRRARWFDPELTDRMLGVLNDTTFLGEVRSGDLESHVREAEPTHRARQLNAGGLDQIAESFAEIIDAKSPFTYKHSSQVAMYACAIGERLGMTQEALTRTRRAGLLHDIGKVGVSNRILDKNGPLDGDERAAINLHPSNTWEILKHVRAFDDFSHQAATHHEKLDGSGYPWGLRADELDTMARVLVVADIYEALTADRPYRAGMPQEKALGILRNEQGTKLDAAAVDALAHVVASANEPSPSL